MKFILASKSPRRKEILSQYLDNLIVINNSVDETVNEKFDIYTNLMSISRKKANDIAKDYPDDIVLGSDTIVYLDGEILHKPKNRREAEDYLERLSENVHSVITSFTLINLSNDIIISDYVETKVKFNKLSKGTIGGYLDSLEWEGKAGGYAIQGKGAVLVEEISGDYFSVVGLPISKISMYLDKYFNINLMEEWNE